MTLFGKTVRVEQPDPPPLAVIRRRRDLARMLRERLGKDPVSSRRVAVSFSTAEVFALLRELEELEVDMTSGSGGAGFGSGLPDLHEDLKRDRLMKPGR